MWQTISSHTQMNARIKELDYLKCIFILLMVVFHLVYIGDSYPYAKKLVYTFHMSAFLIISGYLVNINKKPFPFFRTMLWIFIPYAVMETGYTCMSAILPVREKVEGLSFSLLLEKVFASPMGPYWYLHTLVVCSIFYYLIYAGCARLKNISRFILFGVCLFTASYVFGLMSFSNAMYFLIGVAVCQSKIEFLRIFQPSFLALLPLILLCYFPGNLDRSTLAGVAITYLSISFLLSVHGCLSERFKRGMYYIGQNTLIILLFSPIFTILSKMFLSYLTFDPTGLLYAGIATSFTIFGCFFLAWCMDVFGISRFFFGKKTILRDINEEETVVGISKPTLSE